jgi:beta-lactamase superfamily II metal-dependent hydrolase
LRWLGSVVLLGSLLAIPCEGRVKKGESLQIYFVDVEGGQATLFVTPAGQSLLVDTGWAGFDGRDAKRIAAAAKAAGVKKIDYVVITHYHRDHVGGAPQLEKRIKVGTFVDHGPNLENSDVTRSDYAAYEKVLAHAKHMVVKPGNTIPMEGLDVRVLTAAGEHVATAVAGGGQENRLCAEEPEAAEDDSENARSLGLLVTYGSFRALDLGDLTKKKELELVCPKNLIGGIDLFVVSHHGLAQSNSRALVDAVHPRVAVMDNGARKGGSPEAWQTVHDSPGLEDLWQLHNSVEGGAEHNVEESFIANPAEDAKDRGYWIKVAAEWDASFTVVNARNGSAKTYRK